MAEPTTLKAAITERAMAIGFDQIGFAAADFGPDPGHGLDQFLADGFHGDMAWMVEKAHWRRHPQALWPEAKSVIMLAMNYGPDFDPLPRLDDTDRAVISVYAQGKDYHDIIKKRLKTLARWLAETHQAGVKVFVDTAPVMEKPLAVQAGLGWQGKHTNMVSRSFGSWVFLGSIFTTLDLDHDDKEIDHCGRCRNCLDACPTKAFPKPYRLDARRCISYLTIEHKGPIPHEFRKPMGNRIYGCDDCLAVCPWNKFAATARESAFHARDELVGPLLKNLVTMDDAAFRNFFAGSPIKRIGRDRFIRNVLIAVGNSGDPTLATSVEALLADSAAVVRAMAVWALHELAPDRSHALRSKHAGPEQDADVQAEWARLGPT